MRKAAMNVNKASQLENDLKVLIKDQESNEHMLQKFKRKNRSFRRQDERYAEDSLGRLRAMPPVFTG